jgi:hypothetical protein
VRTVTGGSLPATTWQRYMAEALDGVAVTEFAEPAPIPDVRAEAEAARRGGFSPGRRRSPTAALASDGFVDDSVDPSVSAPSTTAPSGSTSTSSTSTTAPDTTRPPITIFPNG